jgi:hypothetical protein
MSCRATLLLIRNISRRARVLRFDALIGLILNSLVRGLLRLRWGAERGCGGHQYNSCQGPHVFSHGFALSRLHNTQDTLCFLAFQVSRRTNAEC